MTRGRFDGNDDFLVQWATLWDDDYLYVAFDVTDDSVHVYDRDYEVRVPDIDGVWLLFDTKHDAPVFEYPNTTLSTRMSSHRPSSRLA